MKYMSLLFGIIGVIILLSFLGGAIRSTPEQYEIYTITYSYEYDELDFIDNEYQIDLSSLDFLMNDQLYSIDLYFEDLDVRYVFLQDNILKPFEAVTIIDNYIPYYNLSLLNDDMTITITNTNYNSNGLIITAYYNQNLETAYNMINQPA